MTSIDSSNMQHLRPPMEAIDSTELKDVYVWGIELIYGLKNYSI